MIQDMDRLLKLPNGTNAAALPELDLKQAMGATASLVGYLELLDNEENFGNYAMQRFDGSQVGIFLARLQPRASLSRSHSRSFGQNLPRYSCPKPASPIYPSPLRHRSHGMPCHLARLHLPVHAA